MPSSHPPTATLFRQPPEAGTSRNDAGKSSPSLLHQDSRKGFVPDQDGENPHADVFDILADLVERLQRIEVAISDAVAHRPACEKEWYTTDEVAKLLGKVRFTVSEWCRLGRVNAAKRECGRGTAAEWIISREELERYRNFGLLPDTATSRSPLRVPKRRS